MSGTGTAPSAQSPESVPVRLAPRQVVHCTFSNCPHRADGRCDCSWRERQHWPAAHLVELLTNRPELAVQLVRAGAAGLEAAQDHGLTLLALTQLLEKELPPAQQCEEIRAIVSTAGEVLERFGRPAPFEEETSHAPELR